uniref:RRM domain-containing protein n=1 Tax=Octopus bimaculoides TaxID=37653 RepID=A0A0L8FTD7_OCTBM
MYYTPLAHKYQFHFELFYFRDTHRNSFSSYIIYTHAHTQDLREYFSKFGEVEHCNLKTDPVTKRSRGFGFVLFKEEQTVDKALVEKEHKLHGRNIDPKRANPREPIRKVFVRNLDQNLTENEIREYFGKFGKIVKLELPYDKMRNQRRNYCFIEFESEDAVDKICENAGHQIGSREAQVKKATPVANQRGRGRGGGWNQGGWNQGYNQGYNNYYNQGYCGYGGYGGYGGYDYSYNYNQGAYGGWGDYGQNYGYGYVFCEKPVWLRGNITLLRQMCFGYSTSFCSIVVVDFPHTSLLLILISTYTLHDLSIIPGYDYGSWSGYGQDQGQQAGGYSGKAAKSRGHSGYHPYSR